MKALTARPILVSMAALAMMGLVALGLLAVSLTMPSSYLHQGPSAMPSYEVIFHEAELRHASLYTLSVLRHQSPNWLGSDWAWHMGDFRNSFLGVGLRGYQPPFGVDTFGLYVSVIL